MVDIVFDHCVRSQSCVECLGIDLPRRPSETRRKVWHKTLAGVWMSGITYVVTFCDRPISEEHYAVTPFEGFPLLIREHAECFAGVHDCRTSTWRHAENCQYPCLGK